MADGKIMDMQLIYEVLGIPPFLTPWKDQFRKTENENRRAAV